MKYRRVSTHIVNQSSKPVNTGVFNDVKAENGENIIVGQMVSRSGDGSYALMICGADDPEDNNPKSYNIVFRADGKEVNAVSGNGNVALEQRADGSYSFELRSCCGVIVTAE